MELPLDIKSTLESLLDDYPRDIIKDSAKRIIDRYNNIDNSNNNHINSEIDTKVYSVIRYPATFKAFSSALSYSISHYIGDINNIKTALDIGAGSGAASLETLLNLNLESITLLEKEQTMIDIGEYLFKSINLDNKVKYTKSDITKDKYDIRADLVYSSYVLNELDKSNIYLVLDKMWECTNKILLIVEPGTPKGFEIIKIVREYLLSKGGYILAPCPHMDKCPMTSNDWCHFSTRVSRSKLHKELKSGDAPYEDEKFTYIAFSKSPCSRCNNRILRHPQISSGYITLEVCSKDGLKQIKVTKKDKESFKAARKADAGDEI